MNLLKLSLSLSLSLSLLGGEAHASSEKEKISAFLRVKDEIKTIEACLNSIDGVFDRIVIIHSNEKDDGTVAFMKNWCAQRLECEIHEYPHKVIPSHDKKYRQSVSYENTLAAYNNFGLVFFEPEEWVVKIDADQVYLKNRLKEYVDFVRAKGEDNVKYFFIGYNTFAWNNYFVKFKAVPMNGKFGDSYFIKRKNIDLFKQHNVFEAIILKNVVKEQEFNQPVWFHFMKTLKTSGNIQENDTISKEKILFLSEEEKRLFQENILPYLKNSPYRDLKLEHD